MGEERAVNLEHTRSCGAWHWDEPCTCALKERIELASALERIRELEAILVSPGKVEGWREERERCHAIVMARAALWNEHAKVGHEGDCSMSLAEECEDIAEAIRNLPSPPISSRAEDS